MADYVWVDRWAPPNYRELIRDALSEGEMWYEIRSSHRIMSLTQENYDKAVMAGKHLNKIFPSSELFYVWRGKNEIEDIKIY